MTSRSGTIALLVAMGMVVVATPSEVEAQSPPNDAAKGQAVASKKKQKTNAKQPATQTRLDPGVISAAKILANAQQHGQAAVLFIRQGKSGKPSIVIALGEDAEKFTITTGDTAAVASVAPPGSRGEGEEATGAAADDGRPADKETSLRRSSWFDLAAGVGVLSRQFAYSGSIGNSTNLRAYEAPAMAMIEVGASVFPAAGTKLHALHGFGAHGHFGHAFTTEASTDGVSRFDTGSHRWRAGLVYGLPVTEWAKLRFGFDYGQQLFSFDELNPEASQIVSEAPAVNYRFLRPSLGGSSRLGQLSLSLVAAYLGVLDGGETYDRFRDPSLHGIDIGAKVALALPYGFGLQLAADYRRLFSSFDPELGDVFVAGGALEQFITSTVGASYAFKTTN